MFQIFSLMQTRNILHSLSSPQVSEFKIITMFATVSLTQGMGLLTPEGKLLSLTLSEEKAFMKQEMLPFHSVPFPSLALPCLPSLPSLPFSSFPLPCPVLPPSPHLHSLSLPNLYPSLPLGSLL